MDVVFPVIRDVIVDDQGYLLDINTTGQQVSGNQHSAGTGAELSHDDITHSLLHVTVLKLQQK